MSEPNTTPAPSTIEQKYQRLLKGKRTEPRWYEAYADGKLDRFSDTTIKFSPNGTSYKAHQIMISTSVEDAASLDELVEAHPLPVSLENLVLRCLYCGALPEKIPTTLETAIELWVCLSYEGLYYMLSISLRTLFSTRALLTFIFLTLSAGPRHAIFRLSLL